MLNHMVGFIVYMLAMMGIIFIAFVVAKKSMQLSLNKNKNGFLSLEGILQLEARKSVYLIKAGTERFLVSSDMNNVNFLTKLDDNNVPPVIEEVETNNTIDPDKPIPLKDFPMDQLLNFNNPQNPLSNILKNLINRK